jgi:hypothetical protein
VEGRTTNPFEGLEGANLTGEGQHDGDGGARCCSGACGLW